MRFKKGVRKRLKEIAEKRWSEVTDSEVDFIKRNLCKKCIYIKSEGSTISICDYIKINNSMRGCKPGIECVTKKKFQEKKKISSGGKKKNETGN